MSDKPENEAPSPSTAGTPEPVAQATATPKRGVINLAAEVSTLEPVTSQAAKTFADKIISSEPPSTPKPDHVAPKPASPEPAAPPALDKFEKLSRDRLQARAAGRAQEEAKIMAETRAVGGRAVRSETIISTEEPERKQTPKLAELRAPRKPSAPDPVASPEAAAPKPQASPSPPGPRSQTQPATGDISAFHKVEQAARPAVSGQTQAAPAPSVPVVPAPKHPDTPKPTEHGVPAAKAPSPQAPTPEEPAASKPFGKNDMDDDKDKDKGFWINAGKSIGSAITSTEAILAVAVVATMLGGPVAGLAVFGGLMAAKGVAKYAHAKYKANKSQREERSAQGNARGQELERGQSQSKSQEQSHGQGQGQGQSKEPEAPSKARVAALSIAGATAITGLAFPPAFLVSGVMLAGIGAVEAGKGAAYLVKRAVAGGGVAESFGKVKAFFKGKQQAPAQAQGLEKAQAQGKAAPAQTQGHEQTQTQPQSKATPAPAQAQASKAQAVAPVIPGNGVFTQINPMHAAKQAAASPSAPSTPSPSAGVVSTTNPLRAATQEPFKPRAIGRSEATPAIARANAQGSPAAPHPDLVEARQKNSSMSQLSFAKAAGVKKALTRGAQPRLTDKPTPSVGPGKAAGKKVEASR